MFKNYRSIHCILIESLLSVMLTGFQGVHMHENQSHTFSRNRHTKLQESQERVYISTHNTSNEKLGTKFLLSF